MQREVYFGLIDLMKDTYILSIVLSLVRVPVRVIHKIEKIFGDFCGKVV